MLRLLVAAFGLLEALFPRQVIDIGTRLSYEHPDEFEPKPWVITAARIEGVLIFLAVVSNVVRRRATQSSDVTEM